MSAEFIEALAALAWPVLALVALALIAPVLRSIITQRAFVIRIGSFELSAQEASDQLLKQIEDLQKKLAALETAAARAAPSAAGTLEAGTVAPPREEGGRPAALRILWVDDKPRNNAAIVAALENEGHRVEIAASTTEAEDRMARLRPDVVVSDIGRPEGRDAGVRILEALRERGDATPVALFTSARGASLYADRAARAGAITITDSPVDLLAALRAVKPRQTS